MRQQRAYFLKYGIPARDLSSGLIVIRGEGYYRSELDFFARLPRYDEQVLEKVFAEWEGTRGYEKVFIGEARAFSKGDGTTLSTLLSPAGKEEEDGIADRWQEAGMRTSYPACLKKMKGPLLERYVQRIIRACMAEDGIAHPLYANIGLPRPHGVQEKKRETIAREADIVMVAPPEATYRTIRRLGTLFGATIDLDPRWHERTGRQKTA